MEDPDVEPMDGCCSHLDVFRWRVVMAIMDLLKAGAKVDWQGKGVLLEFIPSTEIFCCAGQA